jgi:hypothetical protein
LPALSSPASDAALPVEADRDARNDAPVIFPETNVLQRVESLFTNPAVKTSSVNDAGPPSKYIATGKFFRESDGAIFSDSGKTNAVLLREENYPPAGM